MRVVTDWHGCYDDSLKGLIVREAFAHPAKMSRGLTERIYAHGAERGYWRPGDVIVDPFGGVGTVGLVGAYRGYLVISCELEPRFVELAQRNIELHRAKLTRLGLPVPIHAQGDSRRLCEAVAAAQGVVTSPPFSLPGSQVSGLHQGVRKYYSELGRKAEDATMSSAGNLANMPLGDAGAVIGAITSPPYADSLNANEAANDVEARRIRMAAAGHSLRFGPNSVVAQPQRYGVITSPPWTESLSADRPDPDARRAYARENGISNVEHVSPIDFERAGMRDQAYGETDGQIGVLPAGDHAAIVGAITSPPYVDSVNTHDKGGIDWAKTAGRPRVERLTPSEDRHGTQGDMPMAYGVSDGQLGAMDTTTYWSAVAAIYQQLYQLLPVGGAAAVVVKDYVKAKCRVPLCDQTAELLEAIGFTVVERCRAHLVKTRTATTLFGEEQTSTTERKSFFRRLAEKKGSPRIDWEEVVWAIK